MRDNLIEALKNAEATASDFEIDVIAWLIGSFPLGNVVRQCAVGCARIEKLLPEMKPEKSETHALLLVAGSMDKENIVGTVADKIRKCLRG